MDFGAKSEVMTKHRESANQRTNKPITNLPIILFTLQLNTISQNLSDELITGPP